MGSGLSPAGGSPDVQSIADNLGVSLGSTHFHNRSVRLDDEATLNLIDPAFAARQTAVCGSSGDGSRSMDFGPLEVAIVANSVTSSVGRRRR